LAQVRDIFVFCTFTGLAFIDVKQLTPNHLIKDNNGAMWIRKSRQKTGNMCNIPVLSAAQKLIEKYNNHPECLKHNVLFPVMSNQKMNAYLKEIADLCGITKKLSTHVARYTAATVVFLANNVSMENVAKILGHSNTKMAQHYAKVLDSSIMRDMANVETVFSGVNSYPERIN
jgi:site-specific recombinase XerD